MSPRLARVILLVRDVAASTKFFRDGLGLVAETATASHSRLVAGEGSDGPFVVIDVTQAQNEAQTCIGYSPFLTFDVDDLDETLPRLLGLGAALDGPVRRELYGTSAAVRAPCGHMIGLYQGAGLPVDGDNKVAAAKIAKERLAAEEEPRKKG